MVHGKTFSDPDTGRFLRPGELELVDTPKGRELQFNKKLPNVSFEKMSKSKYNGVDPTACISEWGLDATRAHVLFQAPVDAVLNWDEEKIVGVTRWLVKLHDCIFIDTGKTETGETPNWGMTAAEAIAFRPEPINGVQYKFWSSLQQTIESVTKSMTEINSLNKAVSELMTATNRLHILKKDNKMEFDLPMFQYSIITILRLMAPITPAFSSDCWSRLFPEEKDIHGVFRAGWPIPQLNPALDELHASTVHFKVMFDGKFRFLLAQPALDMTGEALEDCVLKAILAHDKAKFWLQGKKVSKVMVLKNGTLYNIILEDLEEPTVPEVEPIERV